MSSRGYIAVLAGESPGLTHCVLPEVLASARVVLVWRHRALAPMLRKNERRDLVVDGPGLPNVAQAVVPCLAAGEAFVMVPDFILCELAAAVAPDTLESREHGPKLWTRNSHIGLAARGLGHGQQLWN